MAHVVISHITMALREIIFFPCRCQAVVKITLKSRKGNKLMKKTQGLNHNKKIRIFSKKLYKYSKDTQTMVWQRCTLHRIHLMTVALT